ncbi:MAG: hypothetical protein LBQ63_00110 [Deltaproteobacteria bacterium]|nr:hypothetical protein [Deltaproteobacteria bacterium]
MTLDDNYKNYLGKKVTALFPEDTTFIAQTCEELDVIPKVPREVVIEAVIYATPDVLSRYSGAVQHLSVFSASKIIHVDPDDIFETVMLVVSTEAGFVAPFIIVRLSPHMLTIGHNVILN